MPYPMSVHDGKDTLHAEAFINARGRCFDVPQMDDHLVVSLDIANKKYHEGRELTAQQRKIGIGVLQQMFLKGLKFLGHTVSSGLLPGMVVRVMLPPAMNDRDPRFVGVVEHVNGDRLCLRTFDPKGIEVPLNLSLTDFVTRQIPEYMGIDGLKQYLIDFDADWVPVELRALAQKFVAGDSPIPIILPPKDELDRMYEALGKDPVVERQKNEDALVADARVAQDIGGSRIARQALGVELDPNEEEFAIPATPESRAWDALITEAVLEGATTISFTRDDCDELQVRIHTHQASPIWSVSAACSVQALYDFVKQRAQMNPESRERQKGEFYSSFLLRRVKCIAETYFNDHGECLVIVPCY